MAVPAGRSGPFTDLVRVAAGRATERAAHARCVRAVALAARLAGVVAGAGSTADDRERRRTGAPGPHCQSAAASPGKGRERPARATGRCDGGVRRRAGALPLDRTGSSIRLPDVCAHRDPAIRIPSSVAPARSVRLPCSPSEASARTAESYPSGCLFYRRPGVARDDSNGDDSHNVAMLLVSIPASPP